MSHTLRVKQIWKYWDFNCTLLVIKQVWAFLPFESQIKSIGIILDVIYLTRTALGQRDFEGSFTGSNIWFIDSGYVAIFKSKMNYFMTN